MRSTLLTIATSLLLALVAYVLSGSWLFTAILLTGFILTDLFIHFSD